MNFCICVLLVYNDNGSVHTLCINSVRVKFISCIYIVFTCVLSIAVFEIAVLVVKIQRYVQLMEDSRKNGSMRHLPCHHKYNKKIFHGVLYSLTMILVFKQLYNTISMRKTMNVITQRHRKCGWRQ